ncbi:MAG: DUF3124 domain-containing protein [Spirochaetes bacterium]|nr:DUF3124 domain-containing protein [Spirochaetota bacterium]
MNYKKNILFILSVIFIFHTRPANAQQVNLIQKGTFYVPAYSSIYHNDLKWDYNLTITLSIHNTDLKNKIIIAAIEYYNSSGKLIQKYINKENTIINPLETCNIGIKERDIRGGIGANFIVKWHAAGKVNIPVIETIMISTKGQQGLSFTSRGVLIEDSE